MNPTDGAKFEHQVAELLRITGYSVERDVMLSGKQVDILATFLAPGGIELRLLVECKSTTRTVGNNRVYELANVFKAIREKHDISQAVLISRAPFSRFAKEAADEVGVMLLTYDDLVHGVGDFRPYLRSLVADYEASSIDQTYIELRFCTPRQLKRLQSISDPTKRRRQSARFGSAIGDYLSEWLESSSSDQILLLGDYGTGKTTICSRFACVLADRCLSQDQLVGRIPLLITLRDYARAPNARQLITDFVLNKCGVRITYETFKKLNELGRFVLILDGFDEMAVRVDPGVVKETVRTLNALVEEHSRVLLTGRPGYFPSQLELETGFRESASKDPYEQALLEGAGVAQARFRHLYILPLTRPQIVEMLEKRRAELSSSGGLTVEQVLDTIEGTYNLADLAERPVLLDLIIKTIPKLSGELEGINSFRLYAIYTDLWLRREETKGRKLIRHDDKVLFSEELSLQMFMTDRLTVHYRELSPVIKRHFHIADVDTLDHFAHDIRTCSYLSRDSGGRYAFAHKSFMEYFVARKLVSEIGEGKNWNFGRRVLTDEIVTFVRQAIGEDERQTLLGWLGDLPAANRHGGRYTWANALTVLLGGGHGLDRTTLAGRNLEGVNLEGASLVGADLGGCRLSRSHLSKANLEAAILEGADLTGAELRGVRLAKANLRRATLAGADMEGSSLEGANLSEATLPNLLGWGRIASFKNARLSGATGLKYEEADYARTRGAIGDPALSDSERERKEADRRKKRLR